MARIFASKNGEESERELRNKKRARNIGAQGMVLLENDGVLPLAKTVCSIALYGNGARHTVKGGTGSGDVSTRDVMNVEQGLEEAGFSITSKAWLDRHDTAAANDRMAYYGRIQKLIAEQGMMAVMEVLTKPFVESSYCVVEKDEVAAEKADAAVYVLARNSGEGKDRLAEAGDYYLDDIEKKSIANLAAAYGNLIVVLNVGGVIDTSFLHETEGIGAVLLMSQAGNTSGGALADVVTGKVVPGGHLTTTWAADYSDYPNARTFSYINGNLDDEYYTEGIYVGYRYFDTFGVTPAYPFGYGLSYTTFSMETVGIVADAKEVKVSVKVANVGNEYTGREVIQIYASAPEGAVEKPYQELMAYAKTRELAPGEAEVLSVTFPLRQMASFIPEQSAFVLEKGTYYIRIGNHSRNTKVAAAITLDADAKTLQVRNCPAFHEVEGMLSSKGATPYGYETEKAEMEGALKIAVKAADIPSEMAFYRSENATLPATDKKGVISMQDVLAKTVTVEELAAQLTVEEMADLCVGSARGGWGSQSIIGAASAACPGAAGDTTSALIESRDVRNMILADGPAGLRLSKTFKADVDGNIIPGTSDAPITGMEFLAGGNQADQEIPEEAVDYYQYCTAIPIATALAQTWDLAAIEEAGDIVGEEMEELGITLWLAPGMNIHRNPLCGRNFEYYSEDPLVAGLSAAADTLGVQRHPGVGTTIKHFAFNNQEDNRMHTNAHVDERTAREIYLKGFEICIKAAQPMSMMTSYNLINGVHAANNHGILTDIARDEWGFLGIVMTDWNTTGGVEMNPGQKFQYGSSSPAGCIKAGNDLIMPGRQEDVDDIINSVDNADAEYPISLGDLQACAVRILKTVSACGLYEDSVPYALPKDGIEGYVKVERQ